MIPRKPPGRIPPTTWTNPPTTAVAVRSKGLHSAELHPKVQLGLAFQGRYQHLLVVAHEWDNGAALAQRDDLLQDAPAVRATVDEVAEEDHRVLLGRLDGFQKGREGIGAPVNVADGDDAVGHGLTVSLLPPSRSAMKS
jgi:hypothetical protein